jgi:peptidyl-prolyl cis-trans isomerase SurA
MHYLPFPSHAPRFFSRPGTFSMALVVAIILACSSINAFGQEGEPLIVDEVIAQINNDVITLSMLRREISEAINVEKQRQQNVPEQKIRDEVESHKPDLIARMVNEQILLQKGKDLDLTQDVESEVNRRLLELAKEQGCKTIECLDEAMKASGVDPQEFRSTARKEVMKSAVMQREVDAKIYYSFTPDQLKKYFAEHPEKFKKEESVDLSDIFLSLAGRNDEDVKAKALQLVAQARGGADFGKLAVANSEMEEGGVRTAIKTNGKIGRFVLSDLRQDFVAGIKDVKGGGISEPVKTDEGYHIFRVDERTAGSSTPEYNEEHVRQAMTVERSDKARADYLQKLRDEAYIKISANYNDTVGPLLHLKPPVVTSKADSDKPKPKPKKKGLLHKLPGVGE